MPIIVRLSGGLGNQMFQYAIGRSLSLKRKTSLWLSKAHYTPSRPRQYQLDRLSIQANILPGRPAEWLEKAYRDGVKRAACVPVLREHGFLGFHPEVMDCSRTALLAGHWQSYKYFDDVADQIRRDFQPSRPISRNNDQLVH